MLEALLAEGCARFGVPGAQLGLLRDGRREVLCAGVLEVGGDAPVVPETPFHAGSIAKPLAATLALDAAARGELDLGAPGPGGWDDPLRDLIGHTSGRPNVLPQEGEDIHAFVARVRAMGRATPAGRFAYGNAGWAVVDLALEAATGLGFEALAAERVLGPLGLAARFGPPPGHAVPHAGGRAIAADPGSRGSSAAGSRWWATAGELLAYAKLHLHEGGGVVEPAAIALQREPHVPVPGATVADEWAAGWARWSRGEHRALGWSGYTAGHRAYLRVFPEQGAAMALLTNAAGPLLGGSGGSALFDVSYPRVLEALGVPRPGDPADGCAPTDPAALAGTYGPVVVEADDAALLVAAPAMGIAPAVRHVRAHGDTFVAEGAPPGGMAIAFDGDLFYLGPFALRRAS